MPKKKMAVTVNHARRVYVVRRDRVLQEIKMSGTRAAPHVAAILRKRGVKVEELGAITAPVKPEDLARERDIQRLLSSEVLAEAS